MSGDKPSRRDVFGKFIGACLGWFLGSKAQPVAAADANPGDSLQYLYASTENYITTRTYDSAGRMIRCVTVLVPDTCMNGLSQHTGIGKSAGTVISYTYDSNGKLRPDQA